MNKVSKVGRVQKNMIFTGFTKSQAGDHVLTKIKTEKERRFQ